MIEWCSNNTSEMDNVTLFANLIEQLEQKDNSGRFRQANLCCGVSDDNLEAEILESEEIQSEL